MMTPEAQRIGIAKACGWTKCRLVVKGSGAPEREPSAHGFPPKRAYEAPCPSYLRDLNAMHEAEVQLMTAEIWPTYVRWLCEKSPIFPHRATAAQRAEAFLKTLGLWVEEPESAATVEGLR